MTSDPQRLAEAWRHHQAGDLATAEQMYRAVLAENPHDAEAWHRLGILAYQSGQFSQAIEFFDEALSIEPGSKRHLDNLAASLLAEDRLDQAAECYREIARVHPNAADAQRKLGNILNRQGRPEQALECFRRAVELDPNDDTNRVRLANLLLELGRTDEALESFRLALRMNWESAEVHRRMALALVQKGNLEEAELRFREAVRLRPDAPDAHNSLGSLLALRGNFTGAAECFRKAIELDPENAQFHVNAAISLQAQNRHEDAVESLRATLTKFPLDLEVHGLLFRSLAALGRWVDAEQAARQALGVDPLSASSHHDLGRALVSRGRGPDALAALRQALQFEPNQGLFQHSLANALRDAGELDEAIGWYEAAGAQRDATADLLVDFAQARRDQRRYDEAHVLAQQALQLDANHAAAHVVRGELLLLSANPAGWAERAWRQFIPGQGGFPFRQPEWNGGEIAGKTIFVHSVPDLDDTLQFLRYAVVLRQRGARVLLGCDKPLTRLVRRMLGAEAVVESGDALPAFDEHASITSLPRVLNQSFENIPLAEPFLHADEADYERWRGELGNDDALRIAIAWQSPTVAARGAWHVPPLAAFAPLAELPGVRLLSAQGGSGREQIAGCRWAAELPDLGGRCRDWADLAALLANVDLVVCGDGPVAHLAGGLGVPGCLVLPWSASWRWLADRDDSPWYPSLRLFRQPDPGAWDTVFARVAAGVKALANESLHAS